MAIHSEVLGRMKQLKPLTCNLQVYSWPITLRKGFEEHYDEYARITGHWTSGWRWGSPTTFAVDMQRCEQMKVDLCLHVSPDIPKNEDWETARDEYANRWTFVNDNLDMNKVGVVYIDLEAFNYNKTNDLTDAVVRHNEAVHNYNMAIYQIAKQFVGDNVQVRRYGHLAAMHTTNPDYGPEYAGRATSFADPVDGGWGCHWYSPMLHNKDRDFFEKTIQNGKRHGIQEGTVWISLGCSVIDWMCPGIPVPYPSVPHSKVMYSWPYNPEISHREGTRLVSDWWHRKMHGEDYSNGAEIVGKKVHSVCIWPGVFRDTMDHTAIHLVAFLEGLSIKKFDSRLQEIQTESVEVMEKITNA